MFKKISAFSLIAIILSSFIVQPAFADFDALFFNLNNITYYDGGACGGSGGSNSSGIDLTGKDNAEKVFNFFKSKGYSFSAIIGIIANWYAESGIKSKMYESESIYPDKYAELEKDPTVEGMGVSWSDFASKYSIGLNESGYLHNGKHYLGIGIGQWTGVRGHMLWEYAKNNNLDIWDLGTQLKFMTEEDVQPRRAFLEEYKNFSGTPEEAAVKFAHDWEGLSLASQDAKRSQAAKDFADEFRNHASAKKSNNRATLANKKVRNNSIFIKNQIKLASQDPGECRTDNLDIGKLREFKINSNEPSQLRDPEFINKIIDKWAPNGNLAGHGDLILQKADEYGINAGLFLGQAVKETNLGRVGCPEKSAPYNFGCIKWREGFDKAYGDGNEWINPKTAEEGIDIYFKLAREYMDDHNIKTYGEYIDRYTPASDPDGWKYGGQQSFMELMGCMLVNVIGIDLDQDYGEKTPGGGPNCLPRDGSSTASISSLSEESRKWAERAKITWIGDSLTEGNPELKNIFKEAEIDGKVSRFLTGGGSVESGMDAVKRLKKENKLHSNVVISLGTNGGLDPKDIDDLIAEIGDGKKVIFVNTNSNVGSDKSSQDKLKSTVDSVIKDAVNKYDNVYRVDFKSASDAKGRKDLYAGDDVHFTEAGNKFQAEMVAQALNDLLVCKNPKNKCTDSGKGAWGTSAEATRTTEDGFPIFIQWDPRWSDIVYGGGMTMGSAACGPTSFAMIAAALGVPNIHPVEVAKKADELGTVVAGVGAAHNQATVLASHYNLQSEQLNNTDVNQINEHLDKGHLIWMGGAGMVPPFAGGGHLIVIRKKLPNGKWLIANANSYSPEEDMREFDPHEVAAHSNVATAVWK